MKEFNTVMRGLSRVSAWYAVLWVVGWGADSLFGGRLLAHTINPQYAGWVKATYPVCGLFVVMFVAAALILLYAAGGGLRSTPENGGYGDF